jgi:hypothetical protein
MGESYTLDDFTRPGWIDRPEYSAYQGIGKDRVRQLHAARGGLVEVAPFGGDGLNGMFAHVAFVHLEMSRFLLFIYDVKSWNQKRVGVFEINTVAPCFAVIGRTFDGVTEVQACPDNSPFPEQIIEQMRWTLDYLAKKGWDGEPKPTHHPA